MLGNQPWVERTLSARTGRRGLRARRPLQARRRARRRLHRRGVRVPRSASSCASARRQRNVLLISGAGKISPGAAKAAGAAGLHPQGLGRRRHRQRGAHGRARDDRLPAAGATTPRRRSPPREREVLDLMARGSTNREIAEALHLSPHTIHEHTCEPLPQARRAQPRRRGPARLAARPDRLAVRTPRLGGPDPPGGGDRGVARRRSGGSQAR